MEYENRDFDTDSDCGDDCELKDWEKKNLDSKLEGKIIRLLDEKAPRQTTPQDHVIWDKLLLGVVQRYPIIPGQGNHRVDTGRDTNRSQTGDVNRGLAPIGTQPFEWANEIQEVPQKLIDAKAKNSGRFG